LLADLPEWIPEALVERQHEDACSAAIVTEDDYGLPTLRGIRRRTLFKMACSLRARGADYPTIAATLSAINANRCPPPLEHTEIDGIVKSVCRYATGTAGPHVNREIHAELDTFALAVYGAKWRGKAGKTDRDVGQQDTAYGLAGRDWIDGYIGYRSLSSC
jgi:Primase C terminal 1 (PriCT-1)